MGQLNINNSKLTVTGTGDLFEEQGDTDGNRDGALRDADPWGTESILLLGLSSLPGVGYWTLYNLRREAGSFVDAVQVEDTADLVASLRGHGARHVEGLPNNWLDAKRELWRRGREVYEKLRMQGIRLIHAGDDFFPRRLHNIESPPYWLFCQGNVQLLKGSSVALVGTRKPSEDGTFLSKYLVGLLREASVVTVSGLAEGIDRLVHEYSVRFGIPTIAVLGTGVFRDFPANSPPVRKAIIRAGGLVVTEYLPWQSYSRQNFVRRNRIQAGLARIVVPIQWQAKSGTAHTVRFASEQGRPLLVPIMPDWSSEYHEEVVLAQQLGAYIFTVPGSEEAILERVAIILDSDDDWRPELPLFSQVNVNPVDDIK